MQVTSVEFYDLLLRGHAIQHEALQLCPRADLWFCVFVVVEVALGPLVQLIDLHQSKLLFGKVSCSFRQIVRRNATRHSLATLGTRYLEGRRPSKLDFVSLGLNGVRAKVNLPLFLLL